ncbi:oligosaccharide flippase family protein [Glaciecola sp. 1036]|uniref:oligosaccharide flippase family protein n=1 Tax=Alteromonadaceae TaxID=72275 RepID=UPI003D036848
MSAAGEVKTAGKKQIVKEFSLVTFAKVLALGSLFVCGVFIARFIGPVEFGFYSAALSFIILFDAIIGQPLDNAVIRFSSHHSQWRERTEKIQGYVLRIKLCVGFALCAIAFLYLDELTTLMFDQSASINLLISVMGCGIILLIVRSSACYFQINQLFAEYAKFDGLQGLLRLVFVGVFILLGVQSASFYVAIYGLGSLCAFVVFFTLIKQNFYFAKTPDKNDKRKIMSYIGVTSFIVVLSTITGKADIPILSTMGTAEETGHYSAAMQIAMIGTLMASYMAVVFYPKVVEMAKQGTLAGMIKLNLWSALAISVFCVPVAIYLVPLVLPLIFGEQFQPSILILQILFVGICADFVVMPILLPFALQQTANKILVGEIVITLLFFIGIFTIPSLDALKMALLVSGIRVLKMSLYLSVTVHFLVHNKKSET